jgi:diacylglycerol kinase (ATP)
VEKNRPFRERLGFALMGLRACWRDEASFHTHIAFAAAAVSALIAIRPAPVWWALVGLVAMLVLAFELLNSAFEKLIDRVHPDQHPEIGAAKDMAAASVLMVSIAALIVAVALVAGLVLGG